MQDLNYYLQLFETWRNLVFPFCEFLVVCYATPPRYVNPLVGWSVDLLFTSLVFLNFLSIRLLPGAPVTSSTALAHLHATKVYPAF